LRPPRQEKKVVLLVLVQNLAARGLARKLFLLSVKHTEKTQKNNNTFFILNTSFFLDFFLLLHVAQTNQLNIILLSIQTTVFLRLPHFLFL
jgi:hypothetical protein